MGREKEAEKLFRTCLEKNGWFVRHIENPEAPGFPDLFAACCSQFALIEIKVTPKGKTVCDDFPLASIVRPVQSAFFYDYSTIANCLYLLFVDETYNARLIWLSKVKSILHLKSYHEVCEAMRYFEGSLSEISDILTKSIV